MNKIVNGVANDYEFPELDWVHHDSKTINENYYQVINGTALYYENYVKQLQQELDQYKNNWEELKKWVKERYEKTEENSSRLTSKDGVPLSQDFYATVVNIQADRKDILNKMKELEENN